MTDPEPALSVVIPHFNDPEGLDRALASLAYQEDPPRFEALVVDNDSTRTPERVCARHPFVLLLSETEKGPGPARTRGARAARGAIIAFLDADCVAAPDWMATICARFAAEPAADVLAGEVRILPADPTRRTALECYEDVYSYRQRLFVERDHYAATCNMAVRAAVFREVGGFGGLSIAEDRDWGRRARAAGKRLVFAPDIRIATPARSSFGELARKWDRQIGHDFAEVRGRPGALAAWTIKTVAMPLSALAELPRILRSDRLSGPVERSKAFVCLARTRLWRMRRMAQLMLGLDAHALAQGWRRTPSRPD
jgi:cellulose synthase/poly-beta-1,6-N-acetylglucosamine synthase-like glycosyltransferase